MTCGSITLQAACGATSAGSSARRIAVVLGVAFLAATLVLGDTMTRRLRRPVHRGQRRHRRRRAQRHRDRQRRRRRAAAALDADARRRSSPPSTASPPPCPSIEGFGQIVGADGDPIGGNGPPTIAGNWIDDPELNPCAARRGPAPPRAPTGRGRDRPRVGRRRRPRRSATARPCRTPEPVDVDDRRHRHVRRRRQPRPATTYAAFTPTSARDAARRPARTRSSSIRVAGRRRRQPGRAPRRRSPPRCPPSAEALTGAELTAETRTTSRATSSASSRRSCWCSPASPCSSPRSASTTRSRS